MKTKSKLPPASREIHRGYRAVMSDIALAAILVIIAALIHFAS